MKIVFISNNLPPVVDGVGDYTYFLGQEFATDGHEVHVVCSTNPDIDPTWSHGLTVHNIIDNWDQAGIQKAITIIQSLKPDWVSLQYVPYSFSPNGMPLAMRQFTQLITQFKIPLATTFHEVCIRLNYTNPKILARGIAQRRVAKTLASASAINITSIDFYEKYLKTWTKKVELIQIGSNIPAIPVSEIELRNMRAKITPNGEFLISTFGKRDHEALLALFGQLIQRRPNCKLLICGKTPKIHIPEQLLPHIHITGFLSREAIFKHLKCSDLFMQFSMGKGGVCNKSGSLAAAFAAGIPILGNRGDMTNQSLLESQTIIFADKHQDKSLKVLLNVIDDPNKLKLHANRTKAYHEKNLAWTAIYHQYLEIMEKLDKLERPVG